MFQIQTERPGLTLVQAETRYAEQLFTLVDKNRCYLRQWLPWLDHNQSPEDSRSFLSHCQTGYASQTQLTTLIFYNRQLAGTTGFNSISHLNHCAEIGYWLGRDFTGQGLMTAATRKIIELGFTHYALNRQIIKVATDNIASRRIAERLNFVHEGTLREAAYQYGEYHHLELYSLLKSDWDAEKP